MTKEQLLKEFETFYGNSDNVRYFWAPGRVNLIGEHIDYNGGIVFPCALDMGITALVQKRKDRVVSFASLNFELKKEFSLDTIVYDKADQWMNYPKGMIHALQQAGYEPGGCNILYYGSIPNGAGLSSSAAIELVTIVALAALFEYPIPMIDMVKMAQQAENEFVGMKCGIMDQFAVGMGKKDHAICLNCDTLDYDYVPLLLGDNKLVIANSNKKRGLTDSKYNERRQECEQALAVLQHYVHADNLCAIPYEDFDVLRNKISDAVLKKRAEHVISENRRVEQAIIKLAVEKDISAFGALMNQSHVSLRDNYEVTGLELDTLAEEAWRLDGVIGSRMTGAGFGGCTVSIVRADFVNEFKRLVGEAYTRKTGLRADFYEAHIEDGAKEICLDEEVE